MTGAAVVITHADEQPARRDQRTWPLALLSGALLGGVLHARYGYTSGTSDHLVLSPLGMHWADPGYFADDWFIREAPQPHWFFDVVTWFGASIGQLSAVYLLYWLASLLVFGFATAVLARTWVPAYPVVATVLVTLLAGITPWWLLGTGSPLWPQALPVVLGGSLLYLTVAALLADHRKLAVAAAVATAVVHVQQGLVVAVILLVLAIRIRRIDWLYAGGAVAAGVVVLAALLARPVVGDLDDFAQVCVKVIPYHCEATSWPADNLVGGLALVGLAMLTFFYSTRPEWAVVVLLPAIGLVGGVLADRYNVPVLGTLAQGLNVYRLDVLMLMTGCWGALTPLFARARLAPAVIVLGWLVLGIQAYEIAPAVPEHGGWWMLLFVAGLIAVGHVRARAVLMVVGLVAAMAGPLQLRRPDVTFLPDDAVREWGAQVHDAVPAGAVLLASPLDEHVRLATGHAVVGNCKDVPYGGAAWRHYVARLDSMGGLVQCATRDTNVYNSLPAERVQEVARRWGADYLVVGDGEDWRTADLVELGWTVVVRPTGPLRNEVLRAPWS